MTNGSSATNSKSVRPGYYCGVDVRNLHVSLLLFRCQLSLSVLACLKRSRISSRCPLKFDHDKSFEPVYIYCDGLIISGFNEGLLNWSYQLSSPYMSYFECVRCSVHSGFRKQADKVDYPKKKKEKGHRLDYVRAGNGRHYLCRAPASNHCCYFWVLNLHQFGRGNCGKLTPWTDRLR